MVRVPQQPLSDRLATLRRDSVRSGQALVLAALMMTVLVAFTGLAVDVGVWLVAKARLQRAVDAAALSVILDRPTPTQTNGTTTWASGACPTATGALATTRSGTIIATHAVPITQVTCVLTRVPRTNQLEVRAWQTVPTAFAKVIGVTQATINVTATADISSFIEIPTSPVCGGAVGGSSTVCDGGVGDSTMDQFGVNRSHTFGDAYTNPTSPFYNNPDGTVVMPEGYLYRVHVEAGYTGALEIQVFDPDNFNQDNPPNPIDTCPGDPDPLASCHTDPNPTYWALNDRQHPDPSMPSIAQNYYASGYHLFWRVDECNVDPNDRCRANGEMTPIQFTLWHLSPDAYDPLNVLPGERTDIAVRSFGPSGGPTAVTDTYTCTAPYGNQASCPDLRWVTLFSIPDVTAYPARVDGTRSFFIYIRALGATNTENVYHLRSGPPFGDPDQNNSGACNSVGTYTKGIKKREHVNGQVDCQWSNGRGAGANTKIYARRSMPVNVMQAGGAVPYIVWLGYIPKTAAGQTLRLRNYDLDRPTACPAVNSGNAVNYVGYFPSDGRRTALISDCGSGGSVWQETLWTVPPESNTAFWGTDVGFWLYADVFQKAGIFWDTAVFEVIFNRARLVR